LADEGLWCPVCEYSPAGWVVEEPAAVVEVFPHAAELP
jgi:hypothetical protein